MVTRLESSPLLSKISVCNNFVYLSGMVTPERDGIEAQAADLLALLDDFLKSAGSNKCNLVHLLIHLKSLDDYVQFNEVYKGWIDPGSIPCRTCVQAELPNPRALVEITAVAALEA